MEIKKNAPIKMPDNMYFERSELNFSTFKNFFVSGKYFEAMKDEKIEPTDAMQFGSIVHARFLDPDALGKFLPIPNVDKRTKEGKSTYQEFLQKAEDENKVLVTQEVWDNAHQVELSKLSAEILSNSQNINENTILWEYKGISCRSKLDCYNPETRTLIDVKTTRDLGSFGKQITNADYHLQLAFYELALQACNLPVDRWQIVAIENTVPYDSAVFDISEELMEYSRAKIKLYLEEYIMQRNFTGFKGICEDKVIEVPCPAYLK